MASVLSGCLASDAARTGRLFGSYVDMGHGGSAAYVDRLHDFSLLEVWSTWTRLEPCNDCWKFAGLDSQFAFVKQIGAYAKSTALVWGYDAPAGSPGDYTPDYVYHLTPAQLHAELKSHIQTIVRRYPSVRVWNVVNEPFTPPNANGAVSLRDNVFKSKLGPGWIREALVDAYEANPHAQFVAINEYNADGVNAKSTQMLDYYRNFLVGAIPGNHLAVGLQMHLDSCPGPFLDTPVPEVAMNIQRFANAGVQTHITEFDYGVRCVGGTFDQKMAVQRAKFHGITAACMAVAKCRAISVWGVGDADSWFRWSLDDPDWPLLFDDNYNAKPAYWGVVDALNGR